MVDTFDLLLSIGGPTSGLNEMTLRSLEEDQEPTAGPAGKLLAVGHV
jgi:hypothetical protein